MSAYTYAVVRCNHRDKDVVRYCHASVESGTQPDGTYQAYWTKAEVRREAKKRGWLVRVHPDGTPGGQWDFCPLHAGDITPEGGATRP